MKKFKAITASLAVAGVTSLAGIGLVSAQAPTEQDSQASAHGSIVDKNHQGETELTDSQISAMLAENNQAVPHTSLEQHAAAADDVSR